MKRRIIEIDREKCNGCGACAEACHEGAIAMVEGKAQLMRDDYCDGLGDCLPACPTGAISFVEREAAAYDEQAVLANKQKKMQEKMRKEGTPLPCGCPGSQSRSIRHTETRQAETVCAEPVSRLSQWPVQIKLVPVRAPYFDGAKLLIAADCVDAAAELGIAQHDECKDQNDQRNHNGRVNVRIDHNAFPVYIAAKRKIDLGFRPGHEGFIGNADHVLGDDRGHTSGKEHSGQGHNEWLDIHVSY